MHHTYKAIFIVLSLVLSLSVVFAEETASTDATESFTVQTSFDWLAGQVTSDGSYGSDVSQTALAVMALDSVGYDTTASQAWLASQLSTDYCYPTSACTTQATSLAVLALNELQDDTNFDNIAAWYQGALSAADVSGDWYLEVVTSSTGNCVVSYELDGTLQEITIAVDAGVFTACGNSHFLSLDDCLQSGLISANPGMSLDVDCGELEGSVVLTQLYKSSSTYYLLSNENAATTQFQVNNGCFGKSSGSTCDVDSTLYSDWALSKLSSSVNTLVYLKEKYDDSDPKRVALMYLVTKDTSYLATLAGLQKSDGSFDRDAYASALAIIALKGDSTYSQNVEDAKSYLRENQGTDGDWDKSVETTALVLYAAFSEDSVTPGSVTSTGTVEVVSECTVAADCAALYGTGYVCQAGTCVGSSVDDGGCNDDSDCDYTDTCIKGSCETACNHDGNCEPDYNENAENCASDCGEEETTTTTTPPTTSSTKTTTTSSSSSWVYIVVLLVVLLVLGGGGYFAYKKGYLDSLLSKFKKGGGNGPQTSFGSPAQSYQPFTSRMPPQQGGFGGAQQPKRPF